MDMLHSRLFGFQIIVVGHFQGQPFSVCNGSSKEGCVIKFSFLVQKWPFSMNFCSQILSQRIIGLHKCFDKYGH